MCVSFFLEPSDVTIMLDTLYFLQERRCFRNKAPLDGNVDRSGDDHYHEKLIVPSSADISAFRGQNTGKIHSRTDEISQGFGAKDLHGTMFRIRNGELCFVSFSEFI